VQLSTGGVNSGVLLGMCTADPERSSPTHYTSIDAILAKDVSLMGLSVTSNVVGELHSKTPYFRDVSGDFQFLTLVYTYLGKAKADNIKPWWLKRRISARYTT
jgi:hypothetical protein